MNGKALNPWLLVGLLWAAATLNYLDRQVVFSIFPLLQHDLGASSFQLGLIGTVFLWSYGLVSPVGGYVADRIGRIPAILGSLLLWSAGTWLTGHVVSVSQMLAARAVIGASEAFYLPAALALIADRHHSRSRSFATGIHQSGLYTGLAAGGVWGGWMGDTAGWRPAFSILGVVGIAYFGLLMFLFRGESSQRKNVGFTSSFLPLLRNRSFRLILAASVAFSLANWLMNTWLPLFFYERFHLSLTNAGFSATFWLQGASYAGVLAGGVAADRWASTSPRARLYTQMIGLLLGAPFLALVSLTASLNVAILALVIFGLGRGCYDCNAMPVLRDVAGESRSATGYGLLNMAGTIAGGIAVGAVGFLKQYLGISAALQIAALTLALGALALFLVGPRAETVLPNVEHA